MDIYIIKYIYFYYYRYNGNIHFSFPWQIFSLPCISRSETAAIWRIHIFHFSKY